MRLALVAGLSLAAGAAGAAEGPSFDCAKAESAVETMICGDSELARLDGEMARLHALALDGPQMTEAEKPVLMATQGAFLESRDGCATAADARTCLVDAYVGRIAALRQGYADARADDAGGISLGPFVAECPGLDAVMGMVFVNADPGSVYLAWRDRVVVLPQAMSASGARYAATLADGDYLFWVKGDEATFEAPGVTASLTCALSEPG